jgi:hypothetical protein
MLKLHQLLLLSVIICATAAITAAVVVYFLPEKAQKIANYPAYAQTARQGSFAEIDAGKYLLTLENIPPQAIYLATNPQLIFGQVPVLEILAQTDFSEKPRAILELFPENDRLIFFILELENYSYDAERSLISYEVRIQKKYCEDKNSFLVACADDNLPEKFITATLFIENLEPKKEYCRYLGQENCTSPFTPPTCRLPENSDNEKPTCLDPNNYTAVNFGNTWFCCLH